MSLSFHCRSADILYCKKAAQRNDTVTKSYRIGVLSQILEDEIVFPKYPYVPLNYLERNLISFFHLSLMVSQLFNILFYDFI